MFTKCDRCSNSFEIVGYDHEAERVPEQPMRSGNITLKFKRGLQGPERAALAQVFDYESWTRLSTEGSYGCASVRWICRGRSELGKNSCSSKVEVKCL
jgi:hypothetical protein